MRLLSCLALLSASAVAAACADEAYCFGECGSDGANGGEGGSSGDAGPGAGGILIIPGAGGFGGGLNCGANTLSDPENCGVCGNRCDLTGAIAACVGGFCVVDRCVAGFYDLSSAIAGCEYACPVAVPEDEVCDGIDNDCDGLVDGEDDSLIPAPAGLCTLTPGTPCQAARQVCGGAEGWSCNYEDATGVELDQGFVRLVETLCDGFDGNCDGVIDETFENLGQPCDDGGIGICRDGGAITCDPTDPAATICDLSLPPHPEVPSAETCNGRDDDCDGTIDDGVVYDMVAIPASGSPQFLVDRYEASRHDASLTSNGVQSSIACVGAGVLPWTGATFAAAKSACEARGAGYRLCTAQELGLACAGSGARAYPYGQSYASGTCNGFDFDGVAGGANDDALVAAGASAPCTTPEGVFDLSGNAAEWTSTTSGQTNTTPPVDIYLLHGGSYLSPEAGLSCSIELQPRAAANTVLGNVGFRCCRTP